MKRDENNIERLIQKCRVKAKPILKYEKAQTDFISAIEDLTGACGYARAETILGVGKGTLSRMVKGGIRPKSKTLAVMAKNLIQD